MLDTISRSEILDFEPIQEAIEIDIVRPDESRSLLLDAFEEQQRDTRCMMEEALRVIEEWGCNGS